MSLLTQASLVLTPTSYKANKLYSVVPSSGSGDMTTTRATTATRVNSSGLVENVATGIPRVDYTDGVANILLEPQRTNLSLYSSEFNNAYWTKNNSTISANLVTSPDGTTTADKIVSNLFTGRIAVSKIFTVTANVKNTFTIYAKAAEWNRICIFHDATTFTEGSFYGGGTVVNLLTGVSSNPSITKSTSVGNGWYRIETSATPTITSHNIAIVPFAPSTTDVNAVVGDGISGVYIWGSQMETGAYATSYIPTTTSTVTRNTDVLSRDNIYTNNLITSAGGTWFVELNNNFSLTRDIGGQFGIGTTSEISFGSGLSIRRDNVTGRLSIIKYTSASGFGLYNTLTDNIKVAIKWNGTTADVFVNGIKVVTSTSFTTTEMQFIQGNTSDVPKYIKSFMLFPTPLTDAQCISLTTL